MGLKQHYRQTLSSHVFSKPTMTDGSHSTSMSVSRAILVLMVLAVLALQFFLQSLFFPLNEVLSPKRLNNIDAPFHLYQTVQARFLCDEGRVVGYDPYFAAGHLGGVTINASSKPSAALFCAADAKLSAQASYKLVTFVMGVLAPALLVMAAALLQMPLAAAAGAGALGILLWWTGASRWYHTAGMVSFTFVSFLLPLVLAAYLRVHARGGLLAIFGVGLLAAVGLFVHPLFAIGACLAGLPLLWSAWGPASRWPRLGFVTLAVALVALGVNAFWWVPTIGLPSFVTAINPYQRVVDPLLAAREMAGVAATAAGGSRLYAALFLAAFVAALAAPRSQRRRVVGLLLAWLVLMAWASLAAALPPLALLQPNRFSAAAWVLLTLPAAAALPWLCQTWPRASLWRRGAMTILLALSLVITAYFVREAGQEVIAAAGAPRYGVQPPEVRGAGPLEEALVTHLQTHTNRSARVFFENSLGRIHDGGHIAGLLALRSDRELIGGPYPFYDNVSAWDDWALGAPYSHRTATALTAALDRYNIGWMVCHTASCKAAMAAQPDIARSFEIAPVTVFTRNRAPGYVVQGRGKVLASCFNRVEVQAAAGQPLVLRYHWVPGLRIEPVGVAEPYPAVPAGPDQRPFVRVSGAPERFVMKLGAGPGLPCSQRDPLALL